LVSQIKENQATYSIKKVTNNVYIFTEIWPYDNNANMGVIIGDDGVLLINTLMQSSAKSLESEIKKITNKPIKYVLNSDSDGFNYNANSYFKNKGATIISHKNLKYATPHTEVLFTDKISIPMGDEIVTAYHTKAHTLDHIDIHLEKSNVLFMGDGFKGHWLTYNGPNGTKGVIEGIDKALSLSNKKTIIVSGNTFKNEKHFLNNKADLIRNKKIYQNFSRRIGALHKEGLTIAEISKDKQLHENIKVLDAYPSFNKYVSSFIAHVIEIDFTPNYKLTENQLLTYTGIYKLDANHSIEVILENGKLFARENGVFIFELAAFSPNKFDFKGNTGFRGTSVREDYLEFQFSATGKIENLRPMLKKDNLWIHVLSTGNYTKIH
jgi:glyoxylase-like metal-dependent hydrolase (beta-lactamase superfamily II)